MANDLMGLDELLDSVRACTACEGLPLGPNPIFQIDRRAPILIVGQAPGRLTHHKGVPFDDPSGERLRNWLGVTRSQFYDPAIFAILPMGLCYPGSAKGGDLPPRSECAPLWRHRILERLENIQLTLVIGKYAHDWHICASQSPSLTQTVARWREFWPELLPLPHPSPRNMRWFKENAWFAADILPMLKKRVSSLIGSQPGQTAG